MARFAGTRNRVEAPLARAGVRIVSVDESAHAILATGNSNHNQILHCQRRYREAVSGAIVSGCDVPDDVAGFPIKRHEVRVQRPKKDLVAHNREAAVDASAAGTNIRGKLPLVHPDRPASPRVESEGAIILSRRIQNPIYNQWSGFELARGAGLVNPLGSEGRHILRVDLAERAEALARIVAGVRHPVLWFFRGVDQTIGGDLGVGDINHKDASEKNHLWRQSFPPRSLRHFSATSVV